MSWREHNRLTGCSADTSLAPEISSGVASGLISELVPELPFDPLLGVRFGDEISTCNGCFVVAFMPGDSGISCFLEWLGRSCAAELEIFGGGSIETSALLNLGPVCATAPCVIVLNNSADLAEEERRVLETDKFLKALDWTFAPLLAAEC